MNHPHPDLGLPSALVKGGLRIVALGGLGEIGRNMTVFETKGKLLIVDCGVLFPEDTQPGIDLILPDFSYIRDRLNDVVGVFLTHGHEDHIGAVPYLLRERADIAIYGSALTLALVTAKLKEHRITPLTREVREGGHEDVGPFELEFVAVNHSIPDALAVVINTDAGRVLATGDFKMDQLPLDAVLQIFVPLLVWVKKALIYLWWIQRMPTFLASHHQSAKLCPRSIVLSVQPSAE